VPVARLYDLGYASVGGSKTKKEVLSMKRLFLSMILFSMVAFPAVAEEQRFTIPIGDSPATGPANAPVTIIEFIDFQ
jgi:hypothetical protein